MSAFDDLIPKKPAQPKVIFQGNANPRIPLDTATSKQDLTDKIKKSQFINLEQANSLRDDFRQSPAVTNYTNALNSYASALQTAENPQGDLSLIYAAAKIFDPGSVVREGEQALISDTQPIVQRLAAQFGKQVLEGGTFSPEARRNLRRELSQRVADMNRAFIGERVKFKKIADRYGLNPIDIIGEHPGGKFQEIEANALGRPVTQLDYSGDQEVGQTLPGGVQAPPATLAAPNATTTTIPVPPQMQQRLADYVANNKGKLNPTDFASAYNFMAQEAGYEGRIDPNSPQTVAEIEALNKGAKFGGVSPVTRDLTQAEQGINAFAQSPVGAGLIGVGQTVTGNFLDELAGGDAGAGIDQIQENSPIASGVGQLAGGLLLPVGKAVGLAGATGAAAGYGAVAGAGAGEGGFTERLDDAALGAGIGAAGGYFGSKLLAKLGGGKPPNPPDGGVRMQQSIDAGIPSQTIGGAKGGFAATVENALANAPGSAGRIRAAQEKAIGEAASAADNLAAKFGDGGSLESRGDALRAGAQKWINRFEEVSGKAYDAIPISKDAAATLPATQATLAELNGKFASNPKLAAALKSGKLAQYMDALGDNSSPLSWGDLKAFRSKIGEEIGEFSFGDKLAKSELRALYAALTDDMKATAVASGPQALAKFNRANDLYREGKKRIDGALVSILGKDGEKPSEAAGALISKISKSNKSTSDIKKLAEIRKSVSGEEWDEVSSSLIRLAGQPLDSEGRSFNPKTFFDTFNDMAPAAKNIIFGGKPELRAALDDFQNVMGGMKAIQGEGNASGTAKIANILLGLTNLTSLGTQAVAANSLARMWTNPKFVRWATGYNKMLRGAAKANGAPNTEKQMELLQKVAVGEPAIAADIAGLQNALQSAFSSTPARLAASPDKENRK